MKIILQKPVDKLGVPGDIVEVADGYARNYLMPRGMAVKAFGFGGVQRARAYHDALFDLATPAMGHPPLIRVAAVDGDGAAAYRRVRDVLAPLSGGGGRPTRP